MQATLYCDISTGIVSNKPGGAALDWPAHVAGDDITLKLRLTQTIDGEASEIDRTLTSLRASLGLPDARPTSGTFKLKIGAGAASAGVNLTAAIAFDASAAAVQSAINALSGLGSLGTAAVSSSGGSWIIQFSGTDPGVAMAAGENGLLPLAFVRHLAYTFDGVQLHELRLIQAPVAFTSSHARVVPAAPSIERKQAGGSSGDSEWNEIQKLTVPPEFRGTYQIRRGYAKSTLLSPADGPDEILAAIAGLADQDGVFLVTNPADNSANIEFAGAMEGLGFDLLDVEVIDAPAGDIVFTLGTDTEELLAFLRSGGSKLQIEVDIEFEDPDDDLTIYALTIIRAEIEVKADVNFAELGAVPFIDWERPPLPRDYIPVTGDSIVTGAQAIDPIAIGDGAATSFTVDHNLDSPVVEVVVQENIADGKILVLGTDYDVEINSDNSLTILALAGAPALNAWLACVQTIGARGRYETHTHPIEEIVGLRAELDAMGENIDKLLALVPVGALTAEASGGTAPARVAQWTLPADLAEIFPTRSGFVLAQGKSLAEIDKAALPRKGGLLAAVHDATTEALTIPLETPDAAHIGRVFQNTSGDPVILPGGLGRRAVTLKDDEFAACDGRVWYKVKRYDPGDLDGPRTFTAATSDVCTAAGHKYLSGDRVRVSSTTTLPAGLSAATDYYVRDVTASTFKLAATSGGAAIDITDTGTGTHSIFFAESSSYYPADFERELFFLAVNKEQLRLKKTLTIDFGVELGILLSNTRAQWHLVVEHGAYTEDTSPGTPAANLAAIEWHPTPILSQRITIAPVATTHLFGVRISRELVASVDTIAAVRSLYGAESNSPSIPASADFALRARLIRFDTEDGEADPRGLVAIVGLAQALGGGVAGAELGKAFVE